MFISSLLLAGGLKIAVIDSQKVLLSFSETQEAYDKLASYKTQREEQLQKELAPLLQEIQTLEQQLNSGFLNEKGKKELSKRYQKKVEEYQKRMLQENAVLAQKQQELFQPVLDDLRKIIGYVAKKKGYDLVLDTAAVIWSKEKNNDITDDVIKELKRRKKYVAPSF